MAKMPRPATTAMSPPARSGPSTIAAEKLAWMRPLAVTRSSVGDQARDRRELGRVEGDRQIVELTKPTP